MVKVGVYIFARAIIDGGNIPHVIGGVGMVMALVTILYGFLMYLPQQDMKRLLAWSTITQLGWMFFGLSALHLRLAAGAGGQHRLHRQPRVR
ncbi:hydrogenase 4 subunit D [Escherichia coli]|uniref:Hydrogenase 4 subunit D n=1 Tax=Escherichia coli TaxID=562 RepID=A0A377DQ88_ECOLX|nr:hydrogenase 4 subunit D [Escherichia coli]